MGLVETLDESRYMKVIQGNNTQTMATHVLQIIFLGITGFRFPIAHFPVTEATASEIHCMFHRAVHYLSTWGFHVKYVNMDGASANRVFMHLNLPSLSQTILGFSEGIQIPTSISLWTFHTVSKRYATT